MVRDGVIVSSVQIFPRIMTIAEEEMPFGGIGNVATDPRERKAGLASRVMEDAISTMQRRGYPFSMLTTTINSYYERFGYRTVIREVAIIPPIPGALEAGVRRFLKEKDFHRVKELYRSYNKGSVGPLVRDDVYWGGQFDFCGEDPDKFLVLDHEGTISGYVRARVYKGHLEILEYAAEGDIAGIFATLLGAVCSLAPQVPVKLYLTDSERERLRLSLHCTVREDTDLMILPLNDRFHPAAERMVLCRNALNFWLSDFF
jgi:predicted acetyltransferase